MLVTECCCLPSIAVETSQSWFIKRTLQMSASFLVSMSACNLPNKDKILSETSHDVIDPKALHVTSTRVGRIAGEHTVGFDSAVDEIMLKQDILSCEALKRYYDPQFEQNKNDKTFLEQVISICKSTGCDRSDIYAAASENLYRIEPGPESAHNLAVLFINRNEFQKAALYLKEALEGGNIDSETRALWYYELAVVSSANKDNCKAIDYARETITLRSDYGKAYLLLGDVFIASRETLGDDFQQRTAFWAAADKYKKAASLDPGLAEEANQKLTDYKGQYPNSEDVFFHDIKEGDSYLVGGCINEYTTVRSRK